MMAEKAPEVASRSVCVFCGAKSGLDPRWAQLARDCGAAIARRGWRLVYGGGRVGLMGELAEAALAGGGEVVGVIPEALLAREVGHRGLTRLEVVPDMAVRKTRMIEVSDAFITLPGGLGTLDELFEVLTLRQTRYHRKPIGILNAGAYWEPLMRACNAMVEAGFVSPPDLLCLQVADDIETLLDQLFTSES
jgi:uncharacterized protein (TIGR00730 family)